MTAKLSIVSTPIGNMEDITQRALRVLSEVDVLLCEDTRLTRKIYEHYKLKSPAKIISYNVNNENQAYPGIIELLKAGKTAALCSSAGYPSVSDPGYPLISACYENDIAIEVIPGPSAVLTALVLSGLPTNSFTFKGFSPRKEGKRKSFLTEEAANNNTLIFFESPYRLEKFLQDALSVYGDRLCAVCWELTKKFEEVKRDYLSEVLAGIRGKEIKGEITIVIAGNHTKFIRPLKSGAACTMVNGQ